MRLCTRHSGRLCALVLYHLIQTRSDFFTIDRAFKKLQNDVKKPEKKNLLSVTFYHYNVQVHKILQKFSCI